MVVKSNPIGICVTKRIGFDGSLGGVGGGGGGGGGGKAANVAVTVVAAAGMTSVVLAAVGLATAAPVHWTKAKPAAGAFAVIVAVAPAQQGTGLGRVMVEAAEAWLAARGVWKVQLLVRRENEAVLGFYDHLGYRDTNSVCLQKVIAKA